MHNFYKKIPNTSYPQCISPLLPTEYIRQGWKHKFTEMLIRAWVIRSFLKLNQEAILF
jgi:hypothetical protein